MLTYNCPQTSQLVRTTIETSKENLKRLGRLKLSVWCPHCQTGHQISAADAIVIDSRVAPTSMSEWTRQLEQERTGDRHNDRPHDRPHDRLGDRISALSLSAR